jgi:type I restriction enzyme, S subunit
MNAERLLAHFDHIADAPGAMSRLRRFILDLAVRGKLVQQDPKDEPASDLLKGIAAERARMVKPRGMRGPQGVALAGADDLPFALPAGWTWARFSEVAAIESNLVDPRGYMSFPHIAPDNIEGGTGRLLPYETIGDAGVFSSKHLFKAGCLLYSKIRPALSKVTLADFEGLCSADMYPLRPFIDRRYLQNFMLAEVFVRQSVIEDNRVAMPKINQESLSKILVAVAPLAEQQRIVAKVDELMALCDRLEKAQTEKEGTRDRLATTSLARLNAPDPDPVVLSEHTRFAFDALPVLIRRSDQVKQLRQTILNLAVRGKLVSQDPNDEPASELLKRITAERVRLVMAGEAKQQECRALALNEVPFDLPENWAWTRLGAICSKTGSGSTPRGGQASYQAVGVPLLRSQNIYSDGLRLDDVAYIDEETHGRMAGTLVKPNDLLLNITGGSLGRCCLVPGTFREANVSQHVAIIRVVIDGVQTFLHRLVLSPYFQSLIVGEQTGAGRGGLPKNRMDQLPVALPPLAEQRRIVAKLDALMVLCDRLEASLVSISDTRRRLLEALLAEALAPADQEAA